MARPMTLLMHNGPNRCVFIQTDDQTIGVSCCWGWNINGQLGYGDTNDIGDNEVPSGAGDVPFL